MVDEYGGRGPFAERLRRRQLPAALLRRPHPAAWNRCWSRRVLKYFRRTVPGARQFVENCLPSSWCLRKRETKWLYAYYAPGTHRLYVGDEAAYQTFINLAVMQNLEPRRRAVYETVPNDPEFWTLWSSSQGGG